MFDSSLERFDRAEARVVRGAVNDSFASDRIFLVCKGEKDGSGLVNVWYGGCVGCSIAVGKSEQCVTEAEGGAQSLRVCGFCVFSRSA